MERRAAAKAAVKPKHPREAAAAAAVVVVVTTAGGISPMKVAQGATHLADHAVDEGPRAREPPREEEAEEEETVVEMPGLPMGITLRTRGVQIVNEPL